MNELAIPTFGAGRPHLTTLEINDLRRQLYQARALLVSQRRLVVVHGKIEVEEEQDSELRWYAIRLEEELARRRK